MIKTVASNVNEARKKITEGLLYYHILRKLQKQSVIEVEVYSDKNFKNFIDKFTFNEFDFVDWCYEYHDIGCKEVLGDLLNEIRYGSNTNKK